MLSLISPVLPQAPSTETIFKTADIEAIFCSYEEPEGVAEIEIVNNFGNYSILLDSSTNYEFISNLKKNTPIKFNLLVTQEIIFDGTLFTNLFAENIRVTGDIKSKPCK
jgi:hypothetical protein